MLGRRGVWVKFVGVKGCWGEGVLGRMDVWLKGVGVEGYWGEGEGLFGVKGRSIAAGRWRNVSDLHVCVSSPGQ